MSRLKCPTSKSVFNVRTPQLNFAPPCMCFLRSLIARAKSATEKAEKPDEGSDRIGQVLAKLRASKVEPCNKFVLPGAAPFLKLSTYCMTLMLM